MDIGAHIYKAYIFGRRLVEIVVARSWDALLTTHMAALLVLLVKLKPVFDSGK